MKKLLMTLAACATALLASAVTTFEDFEGTLGSFSGNGGSVVSYEGTAPSLTNYPFPDAGSKYCAIDADETDKLERTITSDESFLDMYVQFPENASEPTPEISGDTKLVVYLNSENKVVVISGDGTNVTDKAVTPGQWVRLTIQQQDRDFSDAVSYGYRVFIDGVALIGESHFFTSLQKTNLASQIAFDGVGKLDNFAARTGMSPFAYVDTAAAVTDNQKARVGGVDGIYSGSITPEGLIAEAKAVDLPITVLVDLVGTDFASWINGGDSFTINPNGHSITGVDGKYSIEHNQDGTDTYKRYEGWAYYLGPADTDGAYKIDDANDLDELRKGVAADLATAGVTFKQTADIDMANAGVFAGIGTYSANLNSGVAFQGTYDGQGYTISNIDFTQRNYGGVFNQVKGGTIKNLTVDTITCSGFTSGEWGCAIVGNAGHGATLQNLTAAGSFGSENTPCTHNVAGIAIRVCGGSSNVVNGVTMLETLVQNCTNNATLWGSYTKVGGISALTQDQNGVPNDYVLFDGCVNNANIAMVAGKGTEGRDGLSGILGYVADGTQIKDCVNNGTLTSVLASAKIGGIVGWAQGRTLDDLGGNANAANAKMVGDPSGSTITGFLYATVDNGVATTVTGALAKDTTYLLEGSVAASETPVFAFAEAGTIAFDAALGYTFAGTVTVANSNLFDVTSATEEDVTTYTAAGGTAVASLTKNEETTEYNTIAKALDAAENGDTVKLEVDSSEDVSLPTGVSLALNEHTYSGTISAAANGYAVTQVDGVYAVVENTASTWVGESGGLWATASNWSTGAVPDQYTTVTLPDGSAISVTGTSAIPVGNVIVGGAVSVTCTGNLANNYPSIGVYGAVSGEGTLTLNRVGLKSMDADEVVVGCNIYFDGKGHDCFVEAGSFVFNGSFTGTGRCDIITTTAFNGAVTIPDGATLRLGKSGFYPVISFGNDATLSGDGTVVIFSNGWDSRNASQLAGIKAKVTAAAWQGVCELSGSMTWIDFGNFGHSGSVVRANGLSGYLRYSSGSTTEVANGITALDIGADGLTLNNGFSSGKYGYTIAAKLTGSGPMHFGTRQNDTAVGQYFLTGDMSEFTGAIDFGTLENYRPAVIIKTASEDNPAVNDYGQIIVAAGRTGELAPKIATAWDAPGGFVIYGEAKVSNGGSITSVNGVAGSGKLVYEFMPTSAPAFCAGVTSPGTSRDVPAWSGAVELPVRNGSGELNLAQFGQTGSKIVLNGITGTDANSIYLANSSKEIAATVELKGLLKLTNGSTDDNYKFAEVTGSGSMFLSATGSAGTPHYTYTFEKLTDYTGEINAVKTSDSKYAALEIGTVAVSSFTLGKKMVDLAANCNLTTSPGAINVEVDGMGSDLNGHHLFKAADGDLYVIAAQVTVDETTTCFATLEAAAEFALANDAQIAKVDPATPTILPGWSYEQGVFTKLDIAQVGETTYKTLDLAIANAGTDDILLINDCAETVTLGNGQTIKPGSYAFSGVLKGAGTIYYADKPTTVPKFEDWTGTFVADWAGGHSTSFPANDYGIEGSVVEVRKLGGGYVPKPGTDNVDRTVLPTISIPEGCCMKLANGYANTKTVFTKVTGAGAMTNNSYTVEIATLENFTGTISSDVGTKIGNVVTSTAAEPGGCLVKGGRFTDVASITVNGSVPAYALEYKADAEQPGIYYHVAATLNNGESIINHGTVVGALSVAYINLPRSFGWIVTVLDAEWEDTGAYDQYFTWNSESRTYTVKTYPVRIATKYYPTLEAAVAEAKDGDNIVLVDNITLDARVEPNLGAGTALTIDLGGYTITREGTSGNGSVFDVKSGNVVITNGVIDCTQDDTAIVADGVYAITARSGANVTLGGLTVTVNSECGACVYPFSGATVTILSGTYANTTSTPYRYKQAWTGMAVNQVNPDKDGDVRTQRITIYGGSFKQVNPALGDDSWADGEGTFLASGYAATWNTSNGSWDVAKSAGIDPSQGATVVVDTTKSEEDQRTEAETKANTMDVVKTAAASNVDQATWNGYFTRSVEKVGDNWVATATLNPAVVLPVDEVEETPLTDMLESVTEAALYTEKTAASVPTKAGLYYWIAGATEVGATTYTPGTAKLGDGTTQQLAMPVLSGENGKAFYKVCVDLEAPVTAP